ncbi:MAG: efflux transporter outer membrane subunit [Verrucomicrobiota bacterium]
MSRLAITVLIAASFGAVSCVVVGPDHVVPETGEPAQFKNKNLRGSIQSDWWKSFSDRELNRLAAKIDKSNFDLQAALARRDQAEAALGVARAPLFPALGQNGEVQRNRASENDVAGQFGPSYSTQYRVGLALNWEIDLWGRIRRLVEAANADADAAQALVEDARLSLTSQLARNYFALRFLDAERVVLLDAVKIREENTERVRARFEEEVTSELDVARAETELAATKADLALLDGPRERFENAIAVLIGEQPSKFQISRKGYHGQLPVIPTGLPVDLLGRRPDVRAAERQLAASSARIGAAKAEFYPRLSLTGSGALSSIDASDFLSWSSRTFAFGPTLETPLFQGGRLKSNARRAEAEHREALANFQQAVLAAFRDVEDSLATLASLRSAATAQEAAVKASSKALELSDLRYEEGLVSYLEVVDSQRERLSAKRAAVQIRAQRFEAAVQLIQALGGGFDS